MSENTATGAVHRHRQLRERGMTTVEYALGVVVVIVMVGVIVVAIQTGTFQELVQELIEAVMGWIGNAFALPFPIRVKG